MIFRLFIVCFFALSSFVYAAPVTSTIPQPSGYSVPSRFNAQASVSSTSTLYTGVNYLQLNVLALNQEFIYQKAILDYIASRVENVALISTVSALDAKIVTIDSKLNALDLKVAQMDPSVITQSISFLIGAFIAMAFVISSKFRN